MWLIVEEKRETADTIPWIESTPFPGLWAPPVAMEIKYCKHIFHQRFRNDRNGFQSFKCIPICILRARLYARSQLTLGLVNGGAMMEMVVCCFSMHQPNKRYPMCVCVCVAVPPFFLAPLISPCGNIKLFSVFTIVKALFLFLWPSSQCFLFFSFCPVPVKYVDHRRIVQYGCRYVRMTNKIMKTFSLRLIGLACVLGAKRLTPSPPIRITQRMLNPKLCAFAFFVFKTFLRILH